MTPYRITDMVSDSHYVVTADFPDEEEAWNWACATFGPGASECMTVEEVEPLPKALADARRSLHEAVGFMNYSEGTAADIGAALPRVRAVQDFLSQAETRKPELSFDELRAANFSRVLRWHPGFPYRTGSTGWNGGDWGNAMAGEAGEACSVIKKMRRAEEGFDDGHEYDPGELREALARELADVVTYADLVAAKYGLELGPWVAKKFNEVSRKWDFPERLVEYR